MAASAGDACRGARRRAVGQDGTVGQDGRGGSEPAGGAGPWSRVDCGALAGRSGGKRRLEAQPARLHCGARSRMPFCRGRRHAGEDRPKRGAGLALRVPSGRKKRSGASACLPPRLRLRPRRPPTQIARRTFQTWQVKLGEVQIEWRLGQVCWTRGPDGAPALPLGHSVRSAAVTAHPRPPLGRPDPESDVRAARDGLPGRGGSSIQTARQRNRRASPARQGLLPEAAPAAPVGAAAGGLHPSAAFKSSGAPPPFYRSSTSRAHTSSVEGLFRWREETLSFQSPHGRTLGAETVTRFSLFGRTHAGRSRSLRLDSSGLLAKVEFQSGAGKKPFRTGRVRAVSGGRVSRSP